jgi:putative component of membrane protein insertase Oxa1/YidC/SpoIIIJ protein YidD
MEAYGRYGFLKATAKTAWRLLRCNPFTKGQRIDRL